MLRGRSSCFLSDETNFRGVLRRSSIADDTRYSAKSSRRKTIPLSRSRVGVGRLIVGDARGLGVEDGCRSFAVCTGSTVDELVDSVLNIVSYTRLIDRVTSRPTQNGSFWRCSSQPISRLTTKSIRHNMECLKCITKLTAG